MPKITLRHSELADFRQCPLKHRLRWIDGWESPTQSGPSRLGSAIHAILAARYLAIKGQQEHFGYADWAIWIREGSDYPDAAEMRTQIGEATWEAFADAADACDLDEEARDLLRWVIDGYVDLHGVDSDWQVLLVETDLTVPFVEPSGKTSTHYDYQFHADLVVYDWSMKHPLLVDHKSTARMLGQDDVDLSDQIGLYCWALTRKGYRHPVPVINQVRTERLQRAMVPQERFRRIFSYRTRIELDNIAADALLVAKAIHSKANQQAPFSSPDPRQCGWKCEFVDTHLAIRKSPQGLDAAPAVLTARGFTVQKEKQF